MAKLICLQSGHEGVTTGATGAPGEQELNVRIRNRLSQILIGKGFVVQLVNANPPASEITKDFDLFLALHGDANIYGTGGGCVGSGDPAYDASWQESARIRDALISEYFPHSGIVNHPERVNVNMTKYYMWNQLSPKTPCVLIEMGVVQDAHDKVILADTDRICNAIARGICKAFGVQFAAPPPPPPQPAPQPTTQVITDETPLALVYGLSPKLIRAKLDEDLKKITDQEKTIKAQASRLDVVEDKLLDADALVVQTMGIIYGKGWTWQKINKLKILYPKQA